MVLQRENLHFQWFNYLRSVDVIESSEIVDINICIEHICGDGFFLKNGCSWILFMSNFFANNIMNFGINKQNKANFQRKN